MANCTVMDSDPDEPIPSDFRVVEGRMPGIGFEKSVIGICQLLDGHWKGLGKTPRNLRSPYAS